MDTVPAHLQPCGPGGHVPHRHRILQKEILWRPPKCDSRVPATLVPDGAAPRTQESHPSALDGLGAHNERFKLHCPLGATPCDPTATMRDPSTPTTRAPSMSGVIGWVLAARRASRRVRARTSGRWRSAPAGCHPLGGHRDDERLEHANDAHAERVGRDWAGLGTT